MRVVESNAPDYPKDAPDKAPRNRQDEITVAARLATNNKVAVAYEQGGRIPNVRWSLPKAGAAVGDLIEWDRVYHILDKSDPVKFLAVSWYWWPPKDGADPVKVREVVSYLNLAGLAEGVAVAAIPWSPTGGRPTVEYIETFMSEALKTARDPEKVAAARAELPKRIASDLAAEEKRRRDNLTVQFEPPTSENLKAQTKRALEAAARESDEERRQAEEKIRRRGG